MTLQYFYDGQFRRYLLHFTRIFSGFQWESGLNADGNTTLNTVPAKLAMLNSQVGSIISQNSENVINSTPQIVCSIQSISIPAERRQAPDHVSTIHISERNIDLTSGKYTSEKGKTYTVNRYMAVPYNVTMQVDLWTSNEQQKQQIMEQILVLFNPSIDLQTGTNAADWTQLGIVELTDVIWSNKSIPIGSNSDIDIASMVFKVPIWISPPAKLNKQTIITEIITDISEMSPIIDYTEFEQGFPVPAGNLLARMITTPGNRCIKVDGNVITLLYPNTLPIENSGKVDSGGMLCWKDLLREYGKFETNVSQLRLKTQDNPDITINDIVGVMELNPTIPNILYLTIDQSTLPANTLSPIDAIINPHKVYPGNGLPVAAEGQRYLLYENISTCEAWGVIFAKPNDIIERINGLWQVVWSPVLSTKIEYVLNSKTNKQLKWNEKECIHCVEGGAAQRVD